MAMQSTHPTTSPLMGLLLLAGIILWLTSPKKLQTLGRMVAAFVITALLIMIPTSIARRGDPQMWGELAAEIGVLIAVAAGAWHLRSLKRAALQKPEPPPTKT
jgi:hypothetical protein